MLQAATRFIDTRVECVGTRQKQDMAINPYFGQAVAMLVNAMEVVDEGGASREVPIIARGASSRQRPPAWRTNASLASFQSCSESTSTPSRSNITASGTRSMF